MSAIISAYNCEKFINDSINSVLSQTHPVNELIIIDDGSIDSTKKRVQEFGDEKIRAISQINQGPGAARNRGIVESSGELIAFLDCDDIWLPEKIEHQVRYLHLHPETGMVSSDNWQWNVGSDTWEYRHRGTPRPGTEARELLVSNIVGNPSAILIWRWVLDDAGYFDESMRWGEDWELWIRIARQAKIGFIPRALSIYRSHGGTLSRTGLHDGLENMRGVTTKAIDSHQPKWQRPILKLRVKSMLALMHSWSIPGKHGSRQELFWQTTKALLFYPFDNLKEKFKLLFLAILGDKRYDHIKSMAKTFKSDIELTPKESIDTHLPPNIEDLFSFSSLKDHDTPQ